MCGAQTNGPRRHVANGSPRKTAAVSSPESSLQRTPPRSQPRPNAWEWKCETCTFFNRRCFSPCEMCGFPRESQSPSADGNRNGPSLSGSDGSSLYQENLPPSAPASPIASPPAVPQTAGRELLAALKRGYVMPPAPKTPPPSPPQQGDEILPGRQILAALKCNENNAKLGPSAHLMAVLKCGSGPSRRANAEWNQIEVQMPHLPQGGNRLEMDNRTLAGWCSQ